MIGKILTVGGYTLLSRLTGVLRDLPRGGPGAASRFGDRIFTLLLASQIVLLALALIFTPQVIELLAPGFSREPQQFALAVALTRITFPYLLLITLVTLWGGILNALHRLDR